MLAVDLLPLSELDPAEVVFVGEVSFLPSELPESLVEGAEAVSDLRLSVIYQPEPLKTIPGGKSTRLVTPPQEGQTVIGSSLTRWRTSNRFRQSVHSYS